MYTLQLSQSLCEAQTDEDVRGTTIGTVLHTAASTSPDAPALQEADGDGELRRCWTYAELLADCERLALALLTRYQPGERVAVWGPNVPEWVMVEFALALAGLTLVTVNPGYQPRELKYVLEQSCAAGLFLVREYRGNPMAKIAAEVVSGIPAIRETIDMENHAALFRETGPGQSLPAVAPDDEAQIQYTSGTTGLPKGVRLHHRGLTNNARHYFTIMTLEPGETFLAIMPLFHTAGCGMSVLGAVQHGCRLVLPRQFDPVGAIQLIESTGAAGVLGVPTMFIMMLEANAVRPRDLATVRIAAAGGSMVAPELIRRIIDHFGCRFSTVYGQTECSPLITVTRPDDPFEDLCETIGQPMPQTDVSIRDPKTEEILPLGAIGEITARSYAVMLDYNDDPAATASAVDVNGWLYTGDLGTMDARGFVRITGRIKDIIIRGGENLFPAEIENVLLEHPDVAEIAVVGVPDARMGEVAAAFVRMVPGRTLDPARLIAHCRATIAAQKTPAHWHEIREWPLTGSGKIQKYVLRDRWIAGDFGH